MDLERILIFGDWDKAHALQVNNSFWLCHIQSYPMQFYQIYTVHIQTNCFYQPCIYAVLPNKTEQTYAKSLKATYTVSENAQPSTILLDFNEPPSMLSEMHIKSLRSKTVTVTSANAK